jgi:hypothetical protein
MDVVKQYSAAYINSEGAVVPMTLFAFDHDLAKVQERVRHLNASQNSGKDWVVAEREIPEWVVVPESNDNSEASAAIDS